MELIILKKSARPVLAAICLDCYTLAVLTLCYNVVSFRVNVEDIQHDLQSIIRKGVEWRGQEMHSGGSQTTTVLYDSEPRQVAVAVDRAGV